MDVAELSKIVEKAYRTLAELDHDDGSVEDGWSLPLPTVSPPIDSEFAIGLSKCQLIDRHYFRGPEQDAGAWHEVCLGVAEAIRDELPPEWSARAVEDGSKRVIVYSISPLEG